METWFSKASLRDGMECSFVPSIWNGVMCGIKYEAWKRGPSFGHVYTKLLQWNLGEPILSWLLKIYATCVCSFILRKSLLTKVGVTKLLAWAWGLFVGIIHFLKARLEQKGPWRLLDWHHGIFMKKNPNFLSSMLESVPLSRGHSLDHLDPARWPHL